MNRIKKLENYLAPLKVKCKCGHSIVIPVYIDSVICSWCGKVVKNNTLVYFKYKLRKKLKDDRK